MDTLNFSIERGDAGLYYVTSPQIGGLLGTGNTVPQALENTAVAMRDLALAYALNQPEAGGDGQMKPPFTQEQD